MNYFKFQSIFETGSNIWWSSTRSGTTGQGHTFETRMLVKQEDNKSEADCYDTEVKTKSSRAQRVRTFTMNFGIERELTRVFGKQSRDGKLCLNRSLRVGKTAIWNNQKIDLKVSGGELRLDAGQHTTGIPLDKIAGVLKNKLDNLLIVNTLKRRDGEDWQYRYPSFSYYDSLDQERFIDALSDGRVAVEFRIRGDKDYGTSFNIAAKEFPHLYTSTFAWADSTTSSKVAMSKTETVTPSILGNDNLAITARSSVVA